MNNERDAATDLACEANWREAAHVVVWIAGPLAIAGAVLASTPLVLAAASGVIVVLYCQWKAHVARWYGA